MPTDPKTEQDRPRPSALRSALRWLRRLATLALALAGIALVAGALFVRHLERELPSATELSTYAPPQVTRILARDGTLLGEDYTERRTVVHLAEVPAVVKLAFLAAEDARFYEHEGLNYLGMLRALWVNVRGGSRQGGSTITQQVVKNVLLSPEPTLDRKMKEVILARKIEQELGKDKIFELYLNQIYFGHGRYGVQEAARYYFGKSVKDLSLAEAATLAGVPKGPSIYNPRDRPEKAVQRRTFVLDQMGDKGFARAELVREAKASSLVVAAPPESVPELAPEVVAEARRVLKELVGEAAAKGGYTIKTSIDPKLQEAGRHALRDAIDDVTERRGGVAPFKRPKKKSREKAFVGDPKTDPVLVHLGEVTGADDAKNEVFVRVGTLEGAIDLAKAERFNPEKLPASKFAEPGALLRVAVVDPGVPGEKAGRKGAKLRLALAPEGALVAIDPRTREVLALVGGYDGVRAGLDRASRARRQPGSTFKAFVYSAAIHARKLTAASLVETDPAKIEGYKPKNSDPSVQHAPLRMRDALARSVNVSAVWIQAQVGAPEVVAWAHALGITSDLAPTPSLALGAYEVTPRELTNAYTTLAAGGVVDEPRLVLEILAPSGRQVPLPSAPPPRRVMTPAEVYVTTSLLRQVVETGTGKAAKALKRPVAGKTGTSNAGKDAWFAGYTADLACGVWVGFDDGAPLGPGESGGRAALPAWVDFMKIAHQGKPAAEFPTVPGVARVKIDPETGLLSRDEQTDALEEVFLEGTQPTETAPSPAEDGAGDGEAHEDPEAPVDAEDGDVPPPPGKAAGTEEEAVVDLPPF